MLKGAIPNNSEYHQIVIYQIQIDFHFLLSCKQNEQYWEEVELCEAKKILHKTVLLHYHDF